MRTPRVSSTHLPLLLVLLTSLHVSLARLLPRQGPVSEDDFHVEDRIANIPTGCANSVAGGLSNFKQCIRNKFQELNVDTPSAVGVCKNQGGDVRKAFYACFNTQAIKGGCQEWMSSSKKNENDLSDFAEGICNPEWRSSTPTPSQTINSPTVGSLLATTSNKADILEPDATTITSIRQPISSSESSIPNIIPVDVEETGTLSASPEAAMTFTPSVARKSSSSLPPGAIAGIVLGSLFFFFTLLSTFLFLYCRRRRRRSPPSQSFTYTNRSFPNLEPKSPLSTSSLALRGPPPAYTNSSSHELGGSWSTYPTTPFNNESGAYPFGAGISSRSLATPLSFTNIVEPVSFITSNAAGEAAAARAVSARVQDEGEDVDDQPVSPVSVAADVSQSGRAESVVSLPDDDIFALPEPRGVTAENYESGSWYGDASPLSVAVEREDRGFDGFEGVWRGEEDEMRDEIGEELKVGFVQRGRAGGLGEAGIGMALTETSPLDRVKRWSREQGGHEG